MDSHQAVGLQADLFDLDEVSPRHRALRHSVTTSDGIPAGSRGFSWTLSVGGRFGKFTILVHSFSNPCTVRVNNLHCH